MPRRVVPISLPVPARRRGLAGFRPPGHCTCAWASACPSSANPPAAWLWAPFPQPALRLKTPQHDALQPCAQPSSTHAPALGPSRRACQLLLAPGVNLLVQVKQHVGAGGQVQAALQVHAPRRHALDLLQHGRQVHDHAVADDAGGLGVEHARGQQVQLPLVALRVVNGVPRIGTALRGKEG